MSMRNLKFLLYEVLDAESLLKYPFFEDHDRESFDLVLNTAKRLADEALYPYFSEMDKKPPELVDGEVKVLPMVRDWLKAFGEGGWFAAGFPYDFEGQQLPGLISTAAAFTFSSANYSAAAFAGLTIGAAHLIITFGSEELQKTYLPRMLAGQWQGTMALTEPQAGSGLSDVSASAEPTGEGYYKISGQKVFISAGDHDGVDNVVHLMLARIKGAPAGVKGISLFVAPKKRVEDGGLVANDLNIAGVFHKMGYRGCPITQLAMGEAGDCRGWLVGEPNKGLSYMFQMMNEARIGVGMAAAALCSGAYYASLEYARERLQGRKVEDKDPGKPQVPIIEHADIKRMLLFQRAVTEGSLSLLLYAAKLADLAHRGDEAEKENNWLLLEILTPVVKSYPSEMSILSTSAGLQILGGYGYTDEFPLEQYMRDTRIHSIHEGTTGIQGMDLLGRKAVMKDGAAMKLFFGRVLQDIGRAGGREALAPYAQRLQDAMNSLQEVTMAKVGLAMKGEIENYLSDATLYLEYFGIIAIAWQWLLQGLAADKALAGDVSEGGRKFYQGKLAVMKYFFHYELPKIQGLAARLKEEDGLTAKVTSELFED